MSEKARKALITENFSIALDILRAHKMRSGLIILGVSIGVAALMGMVSIVLGLKASITDEITSSEQVSLMVMKYDFVVVSSEDEYREMMRRKDIKQESVRAVRESCPSLKEVGFYVEPTTRPSLTLRYKDEKSRMTQLGGCEASLFAIYNLEMEEGRLFIEQEIRTRADVVVIGSAVKKNLFPNVDPIGKEIKIDDEDFLVVGTAAERKTLFGDLANNFAMIPYTTYMAKFWKESDNCIIYASVRQGVDPERAKDEVTNVMRRERGLKANQPNDFSVTTSDATLEMINTITGPVGSILTALSSIGLLVGGIGVMNMMLVSVTERTGEIGLRKAVGATRRDILWQFLIEAGTLTGLGGMLGIIIGMAAASAVSALAGLPAKFSVVYILVGVVLSVAVGIFFGLFPASRASKLDPVKAMSYAK
ncbi:MAG: Cell division protein FtsX [Acidobacteria bacterium]|nr:Cell division protein FtsX [Acidobacteriota bacterium]